MPRWLKRVLTAGALAILATVTKLPGEESTPAGVRRDTALFIKMRDGVQIAADVWLPQDIRRGSGCRLCFVLRATVEHSGRTSVTRFWLFLDCQQPQRSK
jgi:hypothetical protein